jgi:glycosyltransferase involved in cell wall biosynthesis
MDFQPLVSVILPVYNGELFIRDAVESVLHQRDCTLELIIVNDGSTDNTRQIIDEFYDSRITLINLESNVGISEALNTGLAQATGEFVARMDSDDVCVADRFSSQLEFMLHNPEVSIAGGYMKLFPFNGSVVKFPLSNGQIRSCMPIYSPLAHPTVIIRREHFSSDEFVYSPEWNGAEDYELWIRLSRNRKIIFANQKKILLNYRLHKNEKTNSVLQQKVMSYRLAIIALEQLGVFLSENQKRAWCSLVDFSYVTNEPINIFVDTLIDVRRAVRSSGQKNLLKYFDRRVLRLFSSNRFSSRSLLRRSFFRKPKSDPFGRLFFFCAFIINFGRKSISLMLNNRQDD